MSGRVERVLTGHQKYAQIQNANLLIGIDQEMNARELKVKKKLEAEGYKVLRGGAPDFIALKVSPSGEILMFKGVEVKSKVNGLKLSYEQEIYRKLFQLAKIDFEVEVI